MLDLRRLRLLRELNARGTIGAVALALDYSPSAVSQQLALLEKEAGVPLLERVGRNVRLTAAAQTLVGHTDALLARLEEAEADLRGDRRADHRHACASPRSSPPASTCSRPRCAGSSATHPALRVEVTDAEPETSLPSLALGTLDMVLGRPVPVPAAPAGRPAGPRAAAGGAVPHRAARRPSAGGRRRPGRARGAARRAVGDRQGRQRLRRADDPRVPRARRLRARRPPPLQRPADAAGAGRQRAGGDAAAGPGAAPTASRRSSPATSPRRG